ncbi:MAG TPA: STAS domain-containing protein [Terracidiphilus sp.]|nr:STAS domain-containing protein [Terracidiphilus sp.]
MLTSSTIEQLPDGKAVITLTGRLSAGSSLKVLDSQVQNLIDGGLLHLVLDISGVDFADSAGLGLLIHTYGRLNEKQGTIKLKGVQPQIAELLRLTKLDTFLKE